MNTSNVNNAFIIKYYLDEHFIDYSTKLRRTETSYIPPRPLARKKKALWSILRSSRGNNSFVSNQTVNELTMYLHTSPVDVVDDDTNFDLLN